MQTWPGLCPAQSSRSVKVGLLLRLGFVVQYRDVTLCGGGGGGRGGGYLQELEHDIGAKAMQSYVAK